MILQSLPTCRHKGTIKTINVALLLFQQMDRVKLIRNYKRARPSTRLQTTSIFCNAALVIITERTMQCLPTTKICGNHFNRRLVCLAPPFFFFRSFVVFVENFQKLCKVSLLSRPTNCQVHNKLGPTRGKLKIRLDWPGYSVISTLKLRWA